MSERRPDARYCPWIAMHNIRDLPYAPNLLGTIYRVQLAYDAVLTTSGSDSNALHGEGD